MDHVLILIHFVSRFFQTVARFSNEIPFIMAGGAGSGAEVSKSVHLGIIIKHSLLFLGGFAVLFGTILALAAKKWFVKTDPRIEKALEVMAHAHCGACGYAGCEQYAEAVVDDPSVPPNLCTPGGDTCTQALAELTGKEPSAREPHYARIMCGGGDPKGKRSFQYKGVQDCRAAVLAVGGNKACSYGCLGYGTCVVVCPFGALTMGTDNLPIVDTSKCTGCRKCEIACPKKVIEVVRASYQVYVACHSLDKAASTRKKCEVGCIGCSLCVKICPTGAAKLVDNCVHIDVNTCNLCGACVPKCPTKAIINRVHDRKGMQ